MPDIEVLVARSMLEVRLKPERLRPQIIAFLRRVSGERLVAPPLKRRRLRAVRA